MDYGLQIIVLDYLQNTRANWIVFCDLSISPLLFTCCFTGVAESPSETQPPLYSRRPSLSIFAHSRQQTRGIITGRTEYKVYLLPILLNPSRGWGLNPVDNLACRGSAIHVICIRTLYSVDAMIYRETMVISNLIHCNKIEKKANLDTGNNKNMWERKENTRAPLELTMRIIFLTSCWVVILNLIRMAVSSTRMGHGSVKKNKKN